MRADEVFNSIGTFLLNNVIPGATSRGIGANGLGSTEDGSRNLWNIFKYTKNPVFQTYWDKYARQDIAHRIVVDMPRQCWRDVPDIKDKEKDLELLSSMGAFRALEKADILNRIGSMSVLYVGIPDGGDSKEPLGKASPKAMSEVYFTPYPEDGVVVSDVDSDPASPRFGLPELYSLTVMNRDKDDKAGTVGSIKVHHTRIVHLAEGALSNKVQGLSSLAPILNRLDDLEKTCGGAAEGFFRVGQGAWTFEVDPQYASSLKDDPESAKKVKLDAEAFTNGWQRFLMLFGMKATPVDVKVPDSSNSVMDSLRLIAAATGYRLRVLGVDNGGTTTGQTDKESMNSLIRDRQQTECSQWLRDLWGIFAMAGMLKPLDPTVPIEWQPFEAATELEKSEIARNIAQAIAQLSAAVADMAGLSGVDKAALVLAVTGVKINVNDAGADADT
jgi:hypothetical protein